MQKLDRALQRRILEELAQCYPGGIYELAELLGMSTGAEEENELLPNLQYLEEHGLIVSGYMLHETTGGVSWSHAQASSITALGLDFLAEDGGLGAILGVVTIKFHDDILKHLIEARVLASDLPPPEKKRMIDQLRTLPAETTKHLVLKLVDKGLESGPAAMQWLEGLLRSVA